MTPAANVVWAIILVVVVLLTPMVLNHAVRLVKAARNVREHFRHALAAAGGIADHVGHVSALEATIQAGGALIDTATCIDETVVAIDGVFRDRLADIKGRPS